MNAHIFLGERPVIGFGFSDSSAWYIWLIDRHPYGGKNIVWWPFRYLNGVGVVQEELSIRAVEPNVHLYRLRWDGVEWEYDTRSPTELMGGYRIAQEAEAWL